ncbi:hypothetical protein X802_07305 [Thermococcus guaymasensis DSM 11113]|uniref:Uncharacterized protein n=1 Tax=Thermococcus guaymasensis DSM 11113 TaxID=1432656 RepID=A0A0X1KN91_9EURY|nr:hypothetical protein X802_07305 [Thermococcus guaymasensis DSM 11113]
MKTPIIEIWRFKSRKEAGDSWRNPPERTLHSA